MQKNKALTLVALTFVLSLAAGMASAGDCVLHITRTACPGQEKESFSKCGGTASCDETKPAADIAQCSTVAMSACANTRLTTTQYKKVTASFNGAAIDKGIDFCIGHPDYPYAKKVDCK